MNQNRKSTCDGNNNGNHVGTAVNGTVSVNLSTVTSFSGTTPSSSNSTRNIYSSNSNNHHPPQSSSATRRKPTCNLPVISSVRKTNASGASVNNNSNKKISSAGGSNHRPPVLTHQSSMPLSRTRVFTPSKRTSSTSSAQSNNGTATVGSSSGKISEPVLPNRTNSGGSGTSGNKNFSSVVKRKPSQDRSTPSPSSPCAGDFPPLIGDDTTGAVNSSPTLRSSEEGYDGPNRARGGNQASHLQNANSNSSVPPDRNPR